jgi:NAD(P)-dependent dehydrogenase (short-subunit alcohol dehydrogenase family)
MIEHRRLQRLKWALEGLSQSLAAEVDGFGVKVTLIEPTGYSTDWAGSSARHATPLRAGEPIQSRRAPGANGSRWPPPARATEGKA